MSHGGIRLGDASDFIEIEILERGTQQGQNEGDLRLGVSVRSGTFCGSYDQVWIAKQEWAAFVAGLLRLERERSGEASVISIAPEEFEMRLEIIDQAGHLSAQGFLSRYHFWQRTGPGRSRIEFYLSVDPGLLQGIVQGFES